MAKADLQAAMKKRAAATQADDNFVDEVYEGVFGKTKPVQVAQKSSLPLSSLHPFKAANIGFQPYSDENLRALANDIQENGLMEEIIVREYYGNQGEYEILSGHNRVAACRLLGLESIPARIEVADMDRAITIATVTNLQRRQGLLPSERGWAYRALLEAKKCQGKRADLTSVQTEQKLNPNETTRDKVAQFFGVSPSNVQRDIRLTYLIKEFLVLVDTKKLGQSTGVSISYYSAESQKILYDEMTIYQSEKFKLDDAFIQRLKNAIPPPYITHIGLGEFLKGYKKPKVVPKQISFKRKRFEAYLEQIGDEKKLEDEFLLFLKQKYGNW